MKLYWLVAMVLLSITTTGQIRAEEPAWRTKLHATLPLLGHRNWIVVVDSAYPLQTSPGIETIHTGQSQLEVVREVLAAVQQAPHVRGKVFLDAELPYVPEGLAHGIGAYRQRLDAILKSQQVTSLPHEQIIEELKTAGETFKIVVLKTDLTLPYTSVFLRLDAGYWSDEAEHKLRAAMERDNK